jgi:excisionase family DNA binding protein
MEQAREILSVASHRTLTTKEREPGTETSEHATASVEPRTTERGGTILTPATMNIAQAAAYLGIAKSTLYTWRTRRPGFGPRAVKAGGALRYRRSDLDAWIEAHAEALALNPELDTDDSPGSRGNQSSTSGALRSMSRRSGPHR